MKKSFGKFSIIILIIIVLFACKGPNTKPPISTIIINVENGAEYAALIDEVEFYTDATKEPHTLCKVPFNNGKWSLPFPQTIADNYLTTISEVKGGIPKGVTISDPTAKVTTIGVNFYKNGKQVKYTLGHVYDDFPPNLGTPHFMYTNKPVIILGLSPAGETTSVPMIMDLNLKSGYNLLYYSFVVNNPSDPENITLKVSTSTNKKYKWYISSYINSPNMQ